MDRPAPATDVKKPEDFVEYLSSPQNSGWLGWIFQIFVEFFTPRLDENSEYLAQIAREKALAELEKAEKENDLEICPLTGILYEFEVQAIPRCRASERKCGRLPPNG